MQLLLAKYGYRALANIEIIVKLRYPDIVIFNHDPRSTIHPLDLGRKLSVIEFKSEKDPVAVKDITLFLLKIFAVLHQYGTSKATAEFQEISGFMFLADTESFRKLELDNLQLTEVSPGVWQLAYFPFAYIVDLQKLEVTEENELFLLFAGTKHREGLIGRALKEYHTSSKAKLIIAISELIDEDKVTQMAKAANVEIDQGSYWESVRELLGPKVMNDIMTDMEKAYGLKGMLAKFETKEILETIGKDEVLETIGKDEVLETIGKDEILETIGKDEVLETIGKDEVLETIGEKEILSRFEFDLDKLEKYIKERKKNRKSQ